MHGPVMAVVFRLTSPDALISRLNLRPTERAGFVLRAARVTEKS